MQCDPPSGNKESGRTSKRAPRALRRFLASGIDPNKSILIKPKPGAEPRGSWRGCFTACALAGMGRMTQVGKTSRQERRGAFAGLLAYASVMAADIPESTHATMCLFGEDQKATP